jgi:5-methylthioadenosine/S-adenosylhomocysteine deaminase
MSKGGVDYLITGGTLVTLNEAGETFDGEILIRDGAIAHMGPPGSARPSGPVQRVDATEAFVLPGFVQSHIHLCQVLFRGMAEDVPLMEWLSRYIWPLEGAHDDDSLRASVRLGIAELLLGGSTAALDMGTVKHTDVIFEVAEEMGFRLTSGKAMMDKGDVRPGGLLENTDESLEASADLAGRWHGRGLLRYAYAPRFILSCTDELLRKTVALAREGGCLLHTHASENPGEMEAVKAAYGKANVEALHDLGMSGKDVVLAHCVWLTPKEESILEKTGTHIAHCPSTNLKLASGIARVSELRERGINLGIGADGAPCNNRLDAFTETRLAALLQKPQYGADALSALDALTLATRGGARALGIDDQVGMLQVGMRADLAVVDHARAHFRPRAEPHTSLVYAARAGDVRHTFVDGVWRVREGRLVGWDLEAILAEAEAAIAVLKGRAGFA